MLKMIKRYKVYAEVRTIEDELTESYIEDRLGEELDITDLDIVFVEEEGFDD